MSHPRRPSWPSCAERSLAPSPHGRSSSRSVPSAPALTSCSRSRRSSPTARGSCSPSPASGGTRLACLSRLAVSALPTDLTRTHSQPPP
eukprot:8699504-Pyramimonas_sp.AAC.1